MESSSYLREWTHTSITHQSLLLHLRHLSLQLPTRSSNNSVQIYFHFLEFYILFFGVASFIQNNYFEMCPCCSVFTSQFVCLFIHPSMGIWVVFSLRCKQIHSSCYEYSCIILLGGQILSFLLENSLGWNSCVMRYMDVQHFKELPFCFPKWSFHFTIPPAMGKSSSFGLSFFFFSVCTTRRRDSSSPTRDQTHAPLHWKHRVETHWTAREVPGPFLNWMFISLLRCKISVCTLCWICVLQKFQSVPCL